MVVKRQAVADFFKQSQIFAGLNDAQIADLEHLSFQRTISAGTVLVNENECADNFYIIIEGKAEVLKKAEDHDEQYRIAVLSKGDPIGEIAFIDSAPRSGTVKAITTTTVIGLHVSKIKSILEQHGIYAIIVGNLGKMLAHRLRLTNEVTVKSIKKELDATKTQVALGHFMVMLLFISMIYTLLLGVIVSSKQFFHDTTTISLSLIIVFAVVMFITVYKSGFPMSMYGLTTQRWLRSIIEAIIYSLPVMGIILLLKWIAIHSFADFRGEALFDPGAIFRAGVKPSWWLYTLSLIGYIIFCPVQEFIARGCMQSSFYYFLSGSEMKRCAIAIVLSNLIFATSHSHTTIGFATAAFITGMFWGWLYSLQKNLIGVSISHIMIGVWAAFIVGFENLI